MLSLIGWSITLTEDTRNSK